jgi:hypothetical protein
VTQPQEKLAQALKALQVLQQEGRRVFRSNELSRTHRELLLRQGFLLSVLRGWFVSSSPATKPGDTTPWFSSFWEFCASYCKQRFDDDWYLSPDQSLLLHAENTAIPTQIIIYSNRGTNNSLALPFNTSLFDLAQSELLPQQDIVIRQGLRLYSPAAALTKVSEAFFRQHSLESQIVLRAMSDTSLLLAKLLEGGHAAVSGRLVGAFRRIGRRDVADEIKDVMRNAGYKVREQDPFAAAGNIKNAKRAQAPIVARIETGKACEKMFSLFFHQQPKRNRENVIVLNT